MFLEGEPVLSVTIFMPTLGMGEWMEENMSKQKAPGFIQPNQLIKMQEREAQQNGRAPL